MFSWKTKRRSIVLSMGIVFLVTVGIVYCKLNYRVPLRDYTAACLYIAVMDDEICRNELERNIVDGATVEFPPRLESLQDRYHIFLDLNKGMTLRQLKAEIRIFEERLEKSRQCINQPEPQQATQMGQLIL